MNTSAKTVLQEVVADVEKEAQAKYNAKLTKQQNMCMQGNELGGIMGNRDNGSVYMWAKLKSNKVPKSYSVSGLKENQFAASNDLYGSFCRIRVTLQSDDKNIQEKIRKGAQWSSAYFVAGDAFTCGSWIPNSVLESIADDVADKSVENRRKSDRRLRNWLTVAGVLGGGAGGYYLGEGIREGNILTGLSGLNSDTDKSRSVSSCVYNAGLYTYSDDVIYDGNRNYASRAANNASAAGLKSEANDVINALSNYPDRCDNGVCTQEQKQKIKALSDTMRALQTACQNKNNSDDKDEKQNRAITAVSTGVTAIAGGLLVNKLTKDIQRSQLDDAKREAYDEWMNEVGSHIQC